MTSYVKKEHDTKKNIFLIVSIIMLNNFYCDKHLLKIKLECLKRRLSQQITENGKMTATNDVINSK